MNTQQHFLSAGVPTAVELPLDVILLDRFVLRERIGSGPSSAVYRADDKLLSREVAIKVVQCGPESSGDLLKAERKALERVTDHQHVLKNYDLHRLSWTGGDFLLLPMEYAQLGSLRDWLVGGRTSAEAKLDLFVQACLGVQSLHEAGILHLDIKPENLLLCAQENSQSLTLKVSDFGLSLDMHRRSIPSPAANPSPGTPEYMSPEQFVGARRKDLDERSDIYSLGIVLYEMMDGDPPFDGDFDALKEKHLRTPPPKLRSGGEAVQSVVTRCIAKPPEERFGSVRELIEASTGGSAVEVGQGSPCIPQQVVELELPSTINRSIAVYSGLVRVRRPVTIMRGGRLIIGPGVRLIFDACVGMDVRGVLQILGNERNKVIIDGDAWRGLTFSGVGVAGSRIVHASFCGVSSVDANPLAFVDACDVELRDVFFFRNSPSKRELTAGVIRAERSSIALVSCVFSENCNPGTSGTGGAIAAIGSVVRMWSCRFERNVSARGGALFLWQSNVTLENCSLSDNAAIVGGAIYCANSKLQMDRCEFTNNRARGRAAVGGAVFCSDCSPRVLNSTFSGNHSTGKGGAVSVKRGQPTIWRCVFVKNHAHYGAALMVEAGAAPNVDQCRFEENSAVRGPAIYAHRAAPSVFQSSFRKNEAREKGCLFASRSKFRLRGNEFQENRPNDLSGWRFLHD